MRLSLAKSAGGVAAGVDAAAATAVVAAMEVAVGDIDLVSDGSRDALSPGPLARSVSPRSQANNRGSPPRLPSPHRQGHPDEPEARPYPHHGRCAAKAMSSLPTSRLFSGGHSSPMCDEASRTAAAERQGSGGLTARC